MALILIILGFTLFAVIVTVAMPNPKTPEKTDKEFFEEVLNDSRINSREVGEREGIKYFQYMENGKTGFRDLDYNIVIEPIYDSAELFSEGYSAVEFEGKWGLIDEAGKYAIEPRFEYLGSVHDGLAGFRANNKYGFLNVKGEEIVEPQFAWVDEFSEGLCVVRNEDGKCGFIDSTGKIVIDVEFNHAYKFQDGQAKVELNNLWGAINREGDIIIEIVHQYPRGF